MIDSFANCAEKNELRVRRNLASSSEALAAFRRFADDHDTLHVGSRSWPGVRLMSLAVTNTGIVRLPCMAFYSVVTFIEPAPKFLRYDKEHRRDRAIAGSTLIRGAGHSFDYRWTAAHRANWVCLEPELVERVAAKFDVGTQALRSVGGRRDRDESAYQYLVSVLAQEAKADAHPAQAMIVESVSNALACRLIADCATGALCPVSPPGALSIRPFERVRSYVQQNIGGRITLQELAAVAGVSRFHFARQFRLRTGESPLGYVLRIRIDRAKTLLRETDEKISDIAASLGFSDQSHFTRTFKRVAGVPPGCYARSYDRETGFGMTGRA